MNTLKLIKPIAPVLLAVIALCACVKKDDPTKFTINIDDTPWHLRETGIQATYYPNGSLLYVSAGDGIKWFQFSVYLNATSPIGSYVFEANGNNAASIQMENVPFNFISNNNVADAGGSFSVTAFDTAQKKLSCNFQVRCYGEDRITKKVVLATLSNLSFKMDSLKYNNTMSCTVNGVKTVNLQTKTGNFLTCGTDAVNFRFSSTNGPRGLYFSIPLSFGTGTYTVQPGAIFGCSPGKLAAGYYLDSAYYPTTGSINITKMDVVQRKMEANFNLDMKDSRGDRIQITKGSFIINRWTDSP